MVNFTNSGSVANADNSSIHRRKFFAVYDPCLVNNVPSCDLAFIEERLYSGQSYEHNAGDEKYFPSLKDAKVYVKEHFKSGAEYFSLNQSVNPDSLLYIVLDKITYLVS